MDTTPLTPHEITNKKASPMISTNDSLMCNKTGEEINQMTSSTTSATSSLTSPVDSGVQCLDSEEGEFNSIMSASGNELLESADGENWVIGTKTFNGIYSSSVPNYFDRFHHEDFLTTTSEYQQKPHSTTMEQMEEMEHPIKSDSDLMKCSLNSYELLDYTIQNKNITTTINQDQQQQQQIMHVSMSEEVNENLILPDLKSDVTTCGTLRTVENQKIVMDESMVHAAPSIEPIVVVQPVVVGEGVVEQEEQIVFRRQRKKKTKSDTPKKRVSFHEDILNSTKIDDIHINHGFITHEDESGLSLSFFRRGFVRKPDVVVGRYSWAAEGDAPYYEKRQNNREIKSDLYKSRNSSTSSSSTGSISSSVEEEDEEGGDSNNSSSDDNTKQPPRKKPSNGKQPKSSCLKKGRPKKCIDTNVVQEETNGYRKRDSMLDTNILGSLKNILNFSASVPTVESGVAEIQDDVKEVVAPVRNTPINTSLNSNNASEETVTPKPSSTRPNLRLTTKEGFYPNYPPIQQQTHNTNSVPSNIILCGSNVYEHRGISYSYEYDKLQKSFEAQKPEQSPNAGAATNTAAAPMQSSTSIKSFFSGLFRKKAAPKKRDEDFEVVPLPSSPMHQNDSVEEVVEEVIKSPPAPPTKDADLNNTNKRYSTGSGDWADNETTISDYMSDSVSNSRHLNSPKKRANHYTMSTSMLCKGDADEIGSNSGSLGFGVSNSTEKNLLRANSVGGVGGGGSKSSLINRFLKNVTLKKMIDVQKQQSGGGGVGGRNKRYLPIYAMPKGVSRLLEKSNELDAIIEREILDKVKVPQRNNKLEVDLRRDLFRNKLEKLVQTFPVWSGYAKNGTSKPLIVVLTNTTLYISGTKPQSKTVYCNHFVLPYTELDTILLGPNSQTILFANRDRDMQCLIVTGCTLATTNMMSTIEMAMRRAEPSSPACLAAVRQLNMLDMAHLRNAIYRQTAVAKDEEFVYYSIVNVQDSMLEVQSSAATTTPATTATSTKVIGPNNEGPLMFKLNEKDARWETAYFILKAGVLYMFSSASQRLPMSVFPIINGACQGACRVLHSTRPHTFQLIIEGKTLLLAGPDEYVVSEWLQCLIQSASGDPTNNHYETSMQACTLLMTSEHIMSVREALPYTLLFDNKKNNENVTNNGAQVLSCASICDLLSFRLPSAEQSWCILEFSCREVHECSGDWILYFTTNSELEQFVSTLEKLWSYNNENNDSFPLSTIEEEDPINQKCMYTYASIRNSWPSNIVYLQFL